ncbi:AMP-binding protein [Bacillus sp. 2205SS5-2]|uniref:AMP-binding protein n=1 Tax=Bacillus sp. 2205SS5-2 TaxID=3109031 RepID=UPI00300666BB
MKDLLRTTIGELLDEKAQFCPNDLAVIYSDKQIQWSYQQFNDLCRQVAKGFQQLDIQHGDHMAIWATNRPEWLVTQFASSKIGAVLVTVNTNYQKAELEYLLRQSDSSTLILMDTYKSSSFIEMLLEICPELKDCKPGQLKSKRLPHLKNVIILSEKSYLGVYNWKEILELGKIGSEEDLAKESARCHPDDVINMQYTSGTTGFPKGVMLTHSNIINNAFNIAKCMELSKQDRLCIPVPFFHCFGCVLGTLACVTVGATMVPIEIFSPEKVLKTVEKEKCTALHGVPTMFIAELNSPHFAEFDLSSLRTGIMAGSTCPMEVMKGIMNKMGVAEITIAYGQTEASPVITQSRTNDPIELRVQTVGRALPHVEVRIVIPGTNTEVNAGQQGELCTRGYHVMKGYYKNKDATREVIDKDGWLHTGDLAIMDAQGYCRITGRLKDMIIRGGENVYPREIEEFLYQHPKILDVQVIGVPNEIYGEEIMGWVILKEGEKATSKELREYCIGKISKHKIPQFFEFIEGYPMTASGKIQKFKLKEMAEQKAFTTKL